MITRRFEVDNLTGTEVKLGRVGEHRAMCIEFDVRPWLTHYPNGFVMLYITLPASSRTYRPGTPPAPGLPSSYVAATEFENGIISWVVESTDTSKDGQGAGQLILYGDGGEIIQSTTFKTKISPSLSHGGMNGGCGCGPSPMQPWVDQVAHLRMEAVEAAERAEDALDQMQHVTIETAKQVINASSHYEFPTYGSADVIYKAEKEGKLYQWNTTTLEYEVLGGAAESEEEIELIYGGNAYGTS